MERKFDGMTKNEIIDAIAQQLDLAEEMKVPMTFAAFFTMLQ